MLCECGHEFESKVLQKNLIQNWKALKKGDKIETIPGSFYLINDDSGNIIRHPFGYRGKAEVIDIRYNGILIFNEHGETSWIYMGKSYFDENIGIHKRPAKIATYKPKKRKLKY